MLLSFAQTLFRKQSKSFHILLNACFCPMLIDLLAHMLSSTLNLHDKNNIGNKVSFFLLLLLFFVDLMW